MALSAKLQMRQSQALVMTPQLMQSIRLLQFGHLELQEFIATEIEKNPLLELGQSDDYDSDGNPSDSFDGNEPGDSWTGDSGSGEAKADETATGKADSMETHGSEQPRSDADLAETLAAPLPETEIEAALGTEPANVFDRDLAEFRPALGAGLGPSPSAGPGLGPEAPDIEAWCAAPVSLYEHLTSQLAPALHDPAFVAVSREIIGSLDEDGYLRRDLSEIALATDRSIEQVSKALERVQACEPAGIGARDLAECLLLQLRERNRLDPAMQTMISHLDLVARRDFVALRRLCGVDEDDLIDMIGELRALDPRPGLKFSSTATSQTVVPDVFVTPRSDGGWSVELNPQTLPRVLVDRDYYAEIRKAGIKGKDLEFIDTCLADANWLVKSLDQRARTILKVCSEIVRQQDLFFARGVAFLKPLTLKTVADAIDMHESTVSRVTGNKYMMTTRGLFELKYFFTAAIPATAGSEAHSAEAVRHRIRQLIDAEEAEAVLSDDAIVEILRKSGIEIARRTVAKYRESLKIPSSVQRRREKRALAHVARY